MPGEAREIREIREKMAAAGEGRVFNRRLNQGEP